MLILSFCDYVAQYGYHQMILYQANYEYDENLTPQSKLCMSVKTAGLITTLYGGATCIMRGLCAVTAAVRPSSARPVLQLG